jgi:hypothetical protein
MSIMLIMSCYKGFFNVRRRWQSLNTGPPFYLRLVRRCEFIHLAQPTDAPSSRRNSVSFQYPGIPAGLYIYITNLVCYTYFHWLFNLECQHIFGKQTGYICTFSVSLIWALKNNNNVVDKNRNIYASLNQYHNTE